MDIIFYGQFMGNKVGVNDLTPTVDIDQFTRSDGTRTALVTGGSATAVTRRGLYFYRLTGANLNLYDYTCVFITSSDSVDQQEVAGLWTYWSEGNWTNATRTLSSFGTLVSDIWSNGTRTLSSYGTLVSDIWSNTTRTLSSYGTLITDIWANPTRTLSSFGTLVADIWNYTTRTLTEIGESIVASIWSYVSRTLTQSPDSICDTVNGLSTVTIYKYSTIEFDLTIGNITDYDDLWVAVKKNRNDSDANSVFLVGYDDGLIYLWREETVTPTDASIVVEDETTGAIKIRLELDAAAHVAVGENMVYGAKMLKGTDVTVMREGICNVIMPVAQLTEVPEPPVEP